MKHDMITRILALLLILSLVPVTASAQSADELVDVSDGDEEGNSEDLADDDGEGEEEDDEDEDEDEDEDDEDEDDDDDGDDDEGDDD